MFQGLLLIVACTLPSAEKAPVPPDEKPPSRVGQIIISGNVMTPQGIILDRLPLYPGQLLTFPDLRAAEQKLGWLHWRGISAKVAILDADGANPYKDILVTVQETPLTWLLVGVPYDFVSRLSDR